MIRGLVLLALTLLIDLPGTLLRIGVFLLIAAPLAFLFGRYTFFVFVLLALYPTFAVLLALAFPTGYFMTRWQIGARQPSERERQMVDPVLMRFAEAGVPTPRRWYVVDGPTINAFVVGSALYIDRGLLQTEYVAPILAHELGHLNTTDGRYVLAQRRFVIPLFLGLAEGYSSVGQQVILMDVVGAERRRSAPGGCFYLILALVSLLMGGGLGLKLLRRPWLMYWRSREYDADAYAASLGEAGQLADALDSVALALDVAVPFMQDMTHPYVELRVDKLLHFARDSAPATPHALRPWLWRTIPMVVVLALLAPFALGALAAGDYGRSIRPAQAQAAGVVPVLAPAPRRPAASAPTVERAAPTSAATSTPNTQAMIATAVQATAEAAGVLPSATLALTTAPTTDAIQAAVQQTVIALQTAQAESAGPIQVLQPDRVEALSSAYDGKDAAGNVVSYGPKNVVDGNPETAWRTDGGVLGVYIILRYNQPVVINEIGIIPGYAKIDSATGANRFTENRRVTRVRLDFEDGTSQFADLADKPEMQMITLTQPIKSSFVYIVVMGVTDHGGRNYTAISEIQVKGRAVN